MEECGVRRFHRLVKQAVSLRLTADGIAWLKKDGAGYPTRANRALREKTLRELEGRRKPGMVLVL